jgi:hypothetical protein
VEAAVNAVTTLAGPIEADVLSVEGAFEELWKTLAPASAGGDGEGGSPPGMPPHPGMRASLVNLISVSNSSREADAAAEAIGRMIGRVPCRAIIVDSDPNAEAAALKTQVRVIGEGMPFGERQVGCEEVRLTARGAATNALPSAASSVYDGDLPIVLWWPKPPFDRADFKRFAADADRVIVDSASFTRNDLVALANFITQSRKMRTAVSDLNWSRLTPYRQLFAQFFDSAHCREQLSQIESVRIAAQEAAGQLMAAWLYSRLEDSCPPGKVVLTPTEGIRPVFHSMVMKTKGGEFAVTRKDEDTVEARYTLDGEATHRMARIGLRPLEQLLAEEVGFLGRDRAFDATMKWLALTA